MLFGGLGFILDDRYLLCIGWVYSGVWLDCVDIYFPRFTSWAGHICGQLDIRDYEACYRTEMAKIYNIFPCLHIKSFKNTKQKSKDKASAKNPKPTLSLLYHVLYHHGSAQNNKTPNKDYIHDIYSHLG